MEETFSMKINFKARAQERRQAAHQDSVHAMAGTEIEVNLVRVQQVSTTKDAILAAVVEAAGMVVEVVVVEILQIVQVEAADQAGHSLSQV